MRRLFWLAPYALVLALAACGKSHEEAKAPEAAPPEPTAAAEPAPAPTADAAAIDAALANTDRFAGDADQDAWRHPADVLKFLELRPGQHALDYFAAAGYYTRADVARRRRRRQSHRVQQSGVPQVFGGRAGEALRQQSPAERH